MHDLQFRFRRLSDAEIAESVRRVSAMAAWPRFHVLVVPERDDVTGPPIPSELLWSPFRGRHHDESPRAVFIGALTGGSSEIAEVGSVASLDRRDLRRTIARTMCGRCFGEPAAVREAEHLLRAVADLPTGTRVRLGDDGSLVPVASDEGRQDLAGAPAIAPEQR